MSATSLILCWAVLSQSELRPLDLNRGTSRGSSSLGTTDGVDSLPGRRDSASPPATLDDSRSGGSVLLRRDSSNGSSASEGTRANTGLLGRETPGNSGSFAPSNSTHNSGSGQPAARQEFDTFGGSSSSGGNGGAYAPPRETRASGSLSGSRTREAELLADVFRGSAESQLNGRSLPLVDALSRAGSRNQRLEVTRAYWKLAITTADYYWALDENTQVEKVSDPTSDRLATNLLRAARQSTKATIEETLVAARSAQHDLSNLLRQSSQEPLPLAADLPFVGNYRTEFNRIFAGKAAPPRMRMIDQILPVRHEVIEKRAYAVSHAADALVEAEAAFMRGTGTAAQLASVVVICRNEVRKQRKLFLDAVREFNFDIAEYAFNVADPQIRDDTAVSMLIRTPTPSNGVRTSSPAGTRTTFVEQDAVTPASANLEERESTAHVPAHVPQQTPAKVREPAKSQPETREPARLDASQLPSVMRPAQPEEDRLVPVNLGDSTSRRGSATRDPWTAAPDEQASSTSGGSHGSGSSAGNTSMGVSTTRGLDEPRGNPLGAKSGDTLGPATLGHIEDPLDTGSTQNPATTKDLSAPLADPFSRPLSGSGRAATRIKGMESNR